MAELSFNGSSLPDMNSAAEYVLRAAILLALLPVRKVFHGPLMIDRVDTYVFINGSSFF